MLFETLLACFIVAVSAEHDIHYHRYKIPSSDAPVQEEETDACGGFSGKKVYIIADNGELLARCYECAKDTGDTVTVHGRRGNGFATWTLQEVDGKCTLLSDVKKYAARCYNCWRNSSHPDGIFNHISYGDISNHPWAKWKVEKHGDLFSFKADTGNYMARCENCVPDMSVKNAAMVHAKEPVKTALWKIELA